jgi:hypothetical protein
MITVFIPNSNQATLLERAARLRAMADVLWHELKDLKEPLTDAQREACRRVGRWQSEAAAFERAAEGVGK